MIHHLTGKIVEVNPTYAVIECAGVGYLTHITLNTYSQLNGRKEVSLFTLPIYKEDSQTLYGFFERSEREMFTLLISVSGVGGNTARLILSGLSTEEVKEAIHAGDTNLLKSVKGVGGKTAERIIVDLRDKTGVVSSPESGVSASSVSTEAVSALQVLGYNPRITEKLVLNILKEDASMSLESLIKEALKRL